MRVSEKDCSESWMWSWLFIASHCKLYIVHKLYIVYIWFLISNTRYTRYILQCSHAIMYVVALAHSAPPRLGHASLCQCPMLIGHWVPCHLAPVGGVALLLVSGWLRLLCCGWLLPPWKTAWPQPLQNCAGCKTFEPWPLHFLAQDPTQPGVPPNPITSS